ncbi:hypothetical protein LZQ00_10945 [Sphingobacterium sp. SRCM116780]|uniref:hypothetical protein n=1 Tax=Sphingobacterium sp. SRCM116780 TaxID=2907623 RepID=UPI001F3368DA|nr:hypothetical protein [Sphingobacterium sp. SRCM116780]UIR54793.1 hypothetical protein LZQ00_10945 [Sphingobacterium sp. SRCM116780]
MSNQLIIKNTMNDMRNMSVAEIASLEGLTPEFAGVMLLGYYEKNDTPMPIIYSLSTTSAVDDGGSVITVMGKKLIHLFKDDIDIRYFGGKAEVGYNNAAILQNISNYCNLNSKRTIIINSGTSQGFETSSPFLLPISTNINMTSELIYTGIDHVAFFEVGNPTAYNFGAKLRIKVVRKTVSDWLNYDSVGVLVHNLIESTEVFIDKIQGFTRGVVFLATAKGVVYNNITFGSIINCRESIILTNVNNGWTNENNFFGGRIQQTSTNHVDKSRTGIIITSKDNMRYNNNNKFWKPSIELQSYIDITTIPILIEYGNFNSFYEMRSEFNDQGTYGDVSIVTKNDSDENFVIVGFAPHNSLTHSVKSEGNFGGALGHSLGFLQYSFQDYYPVFSNDNIVENCSEYSVTNTYISNGLFFFTSAGTSSNNVSGVKLNSNSININSTRGIGIYIDTRQSKRFLLSTILSSDSPVTSGFRFYIKCYDTTGLLIEGGENKMVKGTGTLSVVYNPATKSWNTGVNNSFFAFTLDRSVAYIDVIVMGGTGTGGANLQGLSIGSFEYYAPKLNKFPTKGLKSTIKPTLTIYNEGTFVKNNMSNTPIGWLFNNGSWQDVNPVADFSTFGLVKQSKSIENIIINDIPNANFSSASDVGGLLADFNSLISEYNKLVTLVNTTKSTLNTKLEADIVSGQQES